jgi:hypothetical protein
VRVRAFLAGREGPGRRAVPAGELLHPLVLAAVAILLFNDWLLKGAGPAMLIATAALDCALWGAARLGAPVDFSLRRGKLIAAAGAIGLCFAAIKLSPDAARAVEAASAAVGLGWRITPDPSDLVALPALAGALWLGWREIARVPLGRIEVLERAWRRAGTDPAPGLADVVACGGDPAAVQALASALTAALAGGPEEPVWQALERLRA